MSGRAQNILLQPRRSKVAKRELRPEELQEVKDAFKVLESGKRKRRHKDVSRKKCNFWGYWTQCVTTKIGC